MTLSPKDPKCDQNLQFTSPSETTIPVTFIWESPLPRPPPPGHRGAIDDRKKVCVRWLGNNTVPENFWVTGKESATVRMNGNDTELEQIVQTHRPSIVSERLAKMVWCII